MTPTPHKQKRSKASGTSPVILGVLLPSIHVVGLLLLGSEFLSYSASPLPNRVREKSPPSDGALYAQGRFVYERNCLICHGKWGDGKGELTPGMQPKPRKFSTAVFKFRSTPSGFLPTDEDLARTIRQGISLSSMPAFAALNDREIRSVVDYVKSFSPKWRKPENFAPPLTIPETPGWWSQEKESARHVIRGKEVYIALCSSCHGTSGDGKGEAAAGLQDAWEEPCPPLDLRQPYIRSGSERKDIYRALFTGLDGTPMPSFQETTSEEQRWELIAYIEQLRIEARRQEATNAAGKK